jgi:3-hydroxyisobutyrate dehydrogenase-like beta-hydroxyacid dehydrogenase
MTTGVGFIGLGQMGGAMAQHLVGIDGGLTVCDVRPEAADPLVEAGAVCVSSPAEVAAASSVVSIMVLDDAQVRDVAAQVLATASPGTVIAIHSTIRPETAVDLAAQAEALGVHVVDAPVSGSFVGAAAGTLAVMVGGSDEAMALCRPSFEAWAGLIVHLGPVGSGTRAKLARNLIHYAAFTAVGEAQRLAEAAGVSLRKLGKVVRHTDAITGGPGAIMLRDTAGVLPPDDDWYDVMGHVRTLGEKDLGLALELAAELGVSLPLAELALDRLATELGVPHELGEVDE